MLLLIPHNRNTWRWPVNLTFSASVLISHFTMGNNEFGFYFIHDFFFLIYYYTFYDICCLDLKKLHDFVESTQGKSFDPHFSRHVFSMCSDSQLYRFKIDDDAYRNLFKLILFFLSLSLHSFIPDQSCFSFNSASELFLIIDNNKNKFTQRKWGVERGSR